MESHIKKVKTQCLYLGAECKSVLSDLYYVKAL